MRERLQRDVVTSSRRAFDISEQRLREGTIDLVTVLQTQQTLYQAEDVLAQAQLAHVAGDRQSLSGARRRLAAEAAGDRRCTVNCRKANLRRRRKRPHVAAQLAIAASSLDRGSLPHFVYVFSGPAAATNGGRAASAAGRRTGAGAGRRRRHAADVPVYLDAVGTIKALNTVTVRPQVDGKLLSVNFKEGQDVKKATCWPRSIPTTYQAQLDQAVAKKAQDEAQLANAKIDLDRYEKLAATNAINKQQADTQRALVAQLDALVQADQAAIDNAKAIAWLHHHRRADRRPHRHPHGRRRQYRARLRRRFGDRGDHPAAADLGAVQPAAAGARQVNARIRQGTAAGRGASP